MSDEPSPLLTLEHVSHHFGDRRVLSEISLELYRHEIVAIIGPNAAGKTTLIRIAAGLLDPDRGERRLEGMAMEALEREAIARRLSLLRQAPPQTFDFSALELVLMGCHARTERFTLPSDDQRQRARDVMATLEIDDLAERPASALSGGELQRVLMARTMMSETDLWLLDEPISHLDVHHQMALLEQVEDHTHSGGGAVAVLHDLTAAHRLCDRVLLLDEGHVIAKGSPDSILTEQRLSDVFEAPLVQGEVEGQSVWVVDAEVEDS